MMRIGFLNSLIGLIFICVLSVHAAGDGPPAEDPPVEAEKSGGTVVTILDPGDEPRRRLRLDLEQDHIQQFLLAIQTTSEQSFLGMPASPQENPELRLTLTTTVTEVDENGQISLRTAVDSVDLEERPDLAGRRLDVLRSAVRGLVNLQLRTTIDDQGRTHRMTAGGRIGANPRLAGHVEALKHAFAQTILPLPEEEIGQGGQWRIESDEVIDAVTVQQRLLCTLTEIDGQRLVIDVKIERDAEPQEIRQPGRPENVRMHLQAYEAGGQGRVVRVLSEPLPVEARFEINSNSEIEIDSPGMGGMLTQKSTTRSAIRPPTPDPEDEDDEEAEEEESREADEAEPGE